MVWVRVLCGVVLATSLAGNGYLLINLNASAAETTSAKKKPGAGTTARRPIVKPATEFLRLPVPPDIAKLDRESLEKKLAAAEAKLEPLLSAFERFELAERAPEHELRLQPYFDELFDVQPDAEPNYELECRGLICKLDSTDSSIDWRMEVQTNIDHIGLFAPRMIGESVYLEVPDRPQNMAGTKLVLRILMSLAMSPVVAACKEQHPEPGAVELTLRLDPGTRRLSVLATGSLADKPSGRCIRKVLDDIIATTAVPPDVTNILEQPFRVHVP